MNETNEDNTNVIPFNVGRRSGEISHEIAHPESKWFSDLSDELIDDPLDDLLNEFPDKNETEDHKRDFISHLENPIERHLSFDKDISAMSECLLAKVDNIKESVQRLKYYLNELNLED